MRALDQPRDVRHDEILVRGNHGTQIGILGRERIISDFGMGARDSRQERRFAGIGEPDQPGVGNDLELHGDPALFRGMSLLDLPRSAVGRGFEVGVAVPAASAASHDHLVAGLLQVAQQIAPIAIAHQRPRGDVDDRVRAAAAEAVGALAVLATFGLPVSLVREVGQVRMAFGRANHHAAPVPAVAAVGPAPRRIFFSPEAEAAVAPRPPCTKMVTRSTNMVYFVAAAATGVCSTGTTLIRRPPWSNITLPLTTEYMRPVAAHADILARVPLRAVLAAEDAAGLGELAAEEFDSQHLRIRVAAVAARSLSFFVSH